MKEVKRTNKFNKHLKEMRKSVRGREIEAKLDDIIGKLKTGEKLGVQYKDHLLSNNGSFQGQRECHLAGDVILVYMVERESLILNQLGSHTKIYDQSRKRAKVKR